MPHCLIHNQSYPQDGYCVYCGKPEFKSVDSTTYLSDPCPNGGNHEWVDDYSFTVVQDKCVKCGQSKPKGSGLLFHYTGDDMVINSDDKPEWPGLKCLNSEDGEHSFIIASIPGEDARCEHCKMKLIGEYLTAKVKTESKTGSGKVTEGWHGCFKAAKKIPKGANVVMVDKISSKALKTISQESILRMWDNKKKEWFELPYIEFDGTTFMLADGEYLPVTISAGADIYIPIIDNDRG